MDSRHKYSRDAAPVRPRLVTALRSPPSPPRRASRVAASQNLSLLQERKERRTLLRDANAHCASALRASKTCEPTTCGTSISPKAAHPSPSQALHEPPARLRHPHSHRLPAVARAARNSTLRLTARRQPSHSHAFHICEV
jgi:MoxR-like ATPase